MPLIDIFPQPDLATTRLPVVTGVWRKQNPLDPAQWTWNEVIASTPRDYAAVAVHISPSPDDQARARYHALAIGPAGSEQIVWFGPSSVESSASRAQANGSFAIPIPIPAGTRVSVSSMGWSVEFAAAQVIGYPAPLPDLSQVTRVDWGPMDTLAGDVNYGRAMILPFGTTAHTKSAWTEITAPGANHPITGTSLPHQYKMLGLAVAGTFTSSALDKFAISMDLAHGAAGAEVAILENFWSYSEKDAALGVPRAIWIPWDRPAGDRIAVRAQTDNPAEAAGLVRVSLMGIR